MTAAQVSLGPQGSTKWNKCGKQRNHRPLLGHHPQCTKRGKEDLNSPIKGHQEMNNLRENFYAGHNFPKQYQQCLIRSRDRGDSVFGHPTNPVHHSRERETLRQGSLEVKTFLQRDLELHSSKVPLESGLKFHPHVQPALNKREPKCRCLDY